MSFIDLATLAMHRRNEMESRITMFLKKCDQSINDINKLKFKAQGFLQQLNCDPSELKERFLKCMTQIDEFTYLITDFNLAFENIEQLGSTEHTPVHDINTILTPVEVQRPNLFDTLSEPTPSTSTACGNFCQTVKTKRKKIPKEDQTLIQFSSGSTSSESVPEPSKRLIEKGVQYEVQEEFQDLTVEENILQNTTSQNTDKEVPAASIPAQAMAQVDKSYSGIIMSVDGTNFWVIIDDCEGAGNLMTEMTEYYKKSQNKFDMEDTSSLTYCAYYDEESDCYYRGLLIRLNEEDVHVAEVFLIDTGERRSVRAGSTRPLAARFAAKPPYARCCHLAGVDLLKCHNKDLLEKHEEFMKTFIGGRCTIRIDDNTSESLGVYVKVDDKETINELIVKEGLALAVDKPVVEGPPEMVNSDIDITEGPEYDDPVEAVTGYHNRDEADICQFYRGGPEKTCFKGARCKKRHVLKHPDGWTLDRVEVRCKLPCLPLPLVDSWLEVLVTHVCHFNKLYVQLQTANKPQDRPPSFGVILPPTNLESLLRDMNSLASRQAYKPLTMAPAPGEIVAALYPPDDKWYRAQVISSTRSDQNVEVMYVDYGNMLWVREDCIRVLDSRWCILPMQAVRCVLAGVEAKQACSRTWARATSLLADMLQDRKLQAHIVGRTYDELIVELIDKDGYSIAEQLAAHEVVTLHNYDVHDDTKVPQKFVVP